MLWDVCGGLGKKTTYRGFNRATQGFRQTGSSMKPLAVLVPAIDKKIITGASLVEDTKSSFKNGNDENYAPKNIDGYLGNITLRRALESSQNIPFVKIMENITPSTSIKYLKKMGITTLTDGDSNLALALGGIERGISPLEMAAAYATIANDGVYIEPVFYSKITTSDGIVLLESKQKTKKVFSKSVAYVVKELLVQPVVGSNGTARNCAISGMDVAAKTGTTDDNYDRWLCGFTNYYTAVTWYGYDLNEEISYSGHQNPASVIWSNVMQSVHSNLPSSTFEKPSDVVSSSICSSTGNVANSNCPNTYTEYFLRGTIPKKCSQHTSKSSSNPNEQLNTNYNTNTNTNSNTNTNTNMNTTQNTSNSTTNIVNNTANETNNSSNNITNSNANNTTNTNSSFINNNITNSNTNSTDTISNTHSNSITTQNSNNTINSNINNNIINNTVNGTNVTNTNSGNITSNNTNTPTPSNTSSDSTNQD